MKEFICPIVTDVGYGNGALIKWPSSGNIYLITAAHVVIGKTFAKLLFGSQQIVLFDFCNPELNINNNVVTVYQHIVDKESDTLLDFAIFKIDKEIETPLTLSEDLPLENTTYDSISHSVVKKEVKRKGSIFENLGKPSLPPLYFLTIHETRATVKELHKTNAIQCNMEDLLEEGRSGSPIIKNNKIFGILHGGDNGNPCVYISSLAIINYVKLQNVIL